MRASRLSVDERHWQLSKGLYLYWGTAGHIKAQCTQHKVPTHISHSTQELIVSAQLCVSKVSVFVSLLVDSKAAGNFISQSKISSLHIPVTRLASPIPVRALDG